MGFFVASLMVGNWHVFLINTLAWICCVGDFFYFVLWKITIKLNHHLGFHMFGTCSIRILQANPGTLMDSFGHKSEQWPVHPGYLLCFWGIKNYAFLYFGIISKTPWNKNPGTIFTNQDDSGFMSGFWTTYFLGGGSSQDSFQVVFCWPMAR